MARNTITIAAVLFLALVASASAQDFEKRYCRENAATDQKACKDWCREHPHKSECKWFCDAHPHKCGGHKNPDNPCVSPGNGGSAPGRLGATRSADQPDQAAVQKAFDSVQSSQEGMLGVSRGPPVPLGSLPIDALEPLLKTLNVNLSKKDVRIVKKKLQDPTGSFFSFGAFYAWFVPFEICSVLTG